MIVRTKEGLITERMRKIDRKLDEHALPYRQPNRKAQLKEEREIDWANPDAAFDA